MSIREIYFQGCCNTQHFKCLEPLIGGINNNILNKHEKAPTCNYLTTLWEWYLVSTNWWELDNDYGICVDSLQTTKKSRSIFWRKNEKWKQGFTWPTLCKWPNNLKNMLKICSIMCQCYILADSASGYYRLLFLAPPTVKICCCYLLSKCVVKTLLN